MSAIWVTRGASSLTIAPTIECRWIEDPRFRDSRLLLKRQDCRSCPAARDSVQGTGIDAVSFSGRCLTVAARDILHNRHKATQPACRREGSRRRPTYGSAGWVIRLDFIFRLKTGLTPSPTNGCKRAAFHRRAQHDRGKHHVRQYSDVLLRQRVLCGSCSRGYNLPV